MIFHKTYKLYSLIPSRNCCYYTTQIFRPKIELVTYIFFYLYKFKNNKSISYEF